MERESKQSDLPQVVHASPSDVLSPFTQKLCSQRKENILKVAPVVLEKRFEKDSLKDKEPLNSSQ
jgi:hypothetical protein